MLLVTSWADLQNLYLYNKTLTGNLY